MFDRLFQITVVVFATFLPLKSSAQSVGECDWRASSELLAEPWEMLTRTFANGQIRAAVIDTIEPAAAAFHLLVLSPPYDEFGIRQCRLVSWGDSGFAGLDLSRGVASYDPSRGLTIQLPATLWSEGDQYSEHWLSVTINSATGDIFPAVQ